MWIVYAVVAFAMVFLVVGIFRAVEFTDLGLRPLTRNILIAFHVIGCILFSTALALSVLQLTSKAWVSGAFFGGIGILFPLHIFAALKRRVRAGRSDPG